MQLVLITNELLRKELLSTGLNERVELVWLSDLNDCAAYKEADGFVDLLFDGQPERIYYLKGLPGLVIINSVLRTCHETDPSFVRINGWPTFLTTGIVEAAAAKKNRRAAEQVLGVFHKTVEWVDDLPGFITPPDYKYDYPGGIYSPWGGRELQRRNQYSDEAGHRLSIRPFRVGR